MKFSSGARLHALVAAATLFSMASAGFGQTVVARYTFTANYNSSAISAISSVTSLTVPAGGQLAESNTSYAKTNTVNQLPESLATAISGGNYLGFTVTPTDGAIAFGNLSFSFGLSNNTSSVDPYTGTWGVFSSATGFAAGNILATDGYSLAKSTGLAASWISPAPSVSLTSIGGSLQNSAVPVEFRIYFWDNSATASSNLILRFDNIELTATTAIPEPGTYALLFGVGALGGAMLCRRRRPAP